jgi:hypothetical protein
MILVNSDYVKSITRLAPTPPVHHEWHTEKGRDTFGNLELTIIRARTPRRFSCILGAVVYVPEFSAARQRSSLGQLSHALEDHVAKHSKNCKPLIFVAGDFNGIKHHQTTLRQIQFASN